jgi:TonB family protein
MRPIRIVAASSVLLLSFTSALAQQAPAADGDGKLVPLIASVPAYPAAAGGVRGHVDVEFIVTPAGTVESPRVVASEPGTVFDRAALSAVERRRYAADEARAPQVVQERIDFAPARPNGTAVAASTGPRNECVREDATYNYGDVVDVSLINACTDPLLVFGCAQGTGKDRGRWVCSDSEQRRQVLVQAGDQRLGRSYAPSSTSDLRVYTYTEDFSVTRAPNTQYWWVACAERDANCRSDARLWTRAVDRQDGSVDPQARSSIALASSD